MISQKLQDAVNEQINAELYSAYLYLSMSACFEVQGLPGFANWMKIQTQEEIAHAMKFYAYVIERMGRVELKAIDGPPLEWKTPLEAFEAALAHEQKVTGLINKLIDLAIEENDHAARGFLQWFVDEQVEEEASADSIVQKIKLAANAPGALFMLDKEMAGRVFNPPAKEE